MNAVSPKTKRLTIDAMLSAMCAVLGYVAIDMGAIKITLENFPILLGALLFGPADGAVIGLLGTLIYQLLRYGVSATTLLWMLPYVLAGAVVGAFAKEKEFKLSKMQTVAITVASELFVMILNTGVIYIDSKIYGYYYPELIVGMLVPRFFTGIAKSVVFGLALPVVIQAVKKAIK